MQCTATGKHAPPKPKEEESKIIITTDKPAEGFYKCYIISFPKSDSKEIHLNLATQNFDKMFQQDLLKTAETFSSILKSPKDGVFEIIGGKNFLNEVITDIAVIAEGHNLKYPAWDFALITDERFVSFISEEDAQPWISKNLKLLKRAEIQQKEEVEAH